MSLTGMNLREKAKGTFSSKDSSSRSSGGSSNQWNMKGLDQINGWMGKGNSSSKEKDKDQSEHVSRPLSSLKDPALFGPPPKHVGFHGGAALPNKITPDTSGLGAPLTRSQIEASHQREEEETQVTEEEPEEKPRQPVPFRADTTGLSTANLPKPPGRLDGADGRMPSAASKPKPGLPPRLPPRQDSSSSASSPVSEPKNVLNQASVNRLGAAEVSVPSLGIGAKPHPGLPPRNTESPYLPARSPTAERPQSPAASPGVNPQLNELQARFSRMGTTSPKPPPTQGWKAPASNPRFNNEATAERLASTRNLRSHEDSDGPIVMQDNTIPKLKKAAPPPPKKKPGLSAHADTGQGPPPIPLSSKPKPSASKAVFEQKDLDLDLQSLWFAKSPIQFPPQAIAKLPGSRGYASSSGWSSNGVRQTHTFNGAIRHNSTLATTKIHLTWDGSNPGLTVKAEQKHTPPPRSLSRQELDTYRNRYGDRVASWCEARMGQQVGNGECWTLAADALAAIAAECRTQHQEPCMTSQGVVHGALVFSYLPPKPSDPPGGVEAAGVARGDIVQFLSGHFKAKNGMGESWAGAPDHTAVVTGVDRGGIVRIVEQNAGGVKRVRESKYDFSELVDGEVRIFRPVGESWIGPLDPSWP